MVNEGLRGWYPTAELLKLSSLLRTKKSEKYLTLQKYKQIPTVDTVRSCWYNVSIDNNPMEKWPLATVRHKQLVLTEACRYLLFPTTLPTEFYFSLVCQELTSIFCRKQILTTFPTAQDLPSLSFTNDTADSFLFVSQADKFYWQHFPLVTSILKLVCYDLAVSIPSVFCFQ